MNNPDNIESIGNKSLLEKRINIRASDYLFKDKINYYKGFTTQKGEEKKATTIKELIEIANTFVDFKEEDIIQRKKKILDSFCNYLQQNGLLSEDTI